MAPIVLLTDFGNAGPYVAAMKGVILGIHPRATIVDLSHEIAPQDVRGAAFVLAAAHAWFPRRTLFVCVVDPGVGSTRRIAYVEAGGRRFLAPDNGLLTLVLRESRATHARVVSNRKLFLPEVSATFHGRDVFAPVAARLAKGLSAATLGPIARGLESLDVPEPVRSRDGASVAACVVWIDAFGNLVTSLRDEPIDEVSIGKRRLRVVRTYSDLERGEAGVLRGSSGHIEVAVRDGSAKATLGAAVGTRLTARLLRDRGGACGRLGSRAGAKR